MSLIIYKCRTCTVFWYKRRPILLMWPPFFGGGPPYIWRTTVRHDIAELGDLVNSFSLLKVAHAPKNAHYQRMLIQKAKCTVPINVNFACGYSYL